MEGLILNKSLMAKRVFLVWISVIFGGAFNGLVQGGDGWDSASHNNVYSSDPLPCTFKGEMYFHADSWIIDRDTECHCNDSDVICDVMTCPYLDCDNPIPIPKEPCPICFHNVIVQLLNVKLHPLNDVMTAYVPVTLTFDIDVLFEEFSQTTSVTGKRLWKVSAWGSSEPDGGGAWHGYVDQVLTARQSSKSHKRDTDFVIDEITFDLVPPSCEAVRYICVSFARGDAPVTKTQLKLIFTGTDDEKKDEKNKRRRSSKEDDDKVEEEGGTEVENEGTEEEGEEGEEKGKWVAE
nr:uncharacterized protein LOC129267109 [Lytechinus pictus]